MNLRAKLIKILPKKVKITKASCLQCGEDFSAGRERNETIDLCLDALLKSGMVFKEQLLSEDEIAISLFNISAYVEMYGSWDKLLSGYKEMFIKQAQAISNARELKMGGEK